MNDFGDFEIIEQLGAGAMGIVYQARQTSLGRMVAIKMLPAETSADPEYVARFKNEAVAAAALNHPHIVHVYAAGAINGVHYFAMEYVEGETLGNRILRKGRIDAVQATTAVYYIAQALEYAWEKARLIHRDIKPDNILISREGTVKVADLGLAKTVIDKGQPQLTHSGTSLGTPYYLSPEQAVGTKALDFRSDIYSLGCTLFHALTGCVPYKGDTALAVMLQHISQPPPRVQDVFPECPGPMVALLERMMRKDPAERHSSYAELVEELSAAISALEAGTSAPAWSLVLRSPVRAMPGGSGSRVARPARPTAPVSANTQSRRDPSGKIWFITVVLVVGLTAFGIWQYQMKNDSRLRSAKSTTPALSQPLPTQPTEADLFAGLDFSGPMPALAARFRASKEMPYQNSLSMRFVPVPGTEIFISIWETRVQDYEKFVNATNRKWLARTAPPGQVILDPLHPAVFLSYEDAQAFCRWLTETDASILGSAVEYRLPTHQEWDRAVGVSESNRKKMIYPWGTHWPPPAKVANLSGMEADGMSPDTVGAPLENWSDGYISTAPVGSYPPNPLGLSDLAGNVTEFVELDSDSNEVLVRGGHFGDSLQAWLMAATRRPLAGAVPRSTNGFRIVLAPKRTSGPPNSATTAPGVPPAARPSLAKANQPYVNCMGMRFVPIPGTSVLFSIWETRISDYQTFIKEKGRKWDGSASGKGELHPASNLTWKDAVEFCKWLTERERALGRLSERGTYRLPTDHEWSRAVGLDMEDERKLPSEKNMAIRSIFPWGSGWPPIARAGNFSGEESRRTAGRAGFIPGYSDDAIGTAPVGGSLPNKFGLYDLAGNVEEWCSDWYDGTQRKRVTRGGSYEERAVMPLYSSARMARTPTTASDTIGFRVVLVP